MRLIACTSCSRQYDVSHHSEGSQVVCVCGEMLTVRHHEPKEPRALRCPGCGAPFAPGSRSCEYCRVEIDALQMRFTSLCPHCHARMTEEARHCMDCGRKIAPQILIPVAKDRNCPRCEGVLVSRRIEATSLIECNGCHGIWLPTASFEEACRKTEQRAALALGLGNLPRVDAAPEVERQQFRYLPCLTCGDLMVPRNFGGNSGVIVDICARHGVWLDAGELQAVAAYLESQKARSDGSTGAGLKRPQPPSPAGAFGSSAGRPTTSIGGNAFSSVVQILLDFFLT